MTADSRILLVFPYSTVKIQVRLHRKLKTSNSPILGTDLLTSSVTFHEIFQFRKLKKFNKKISA